jgi:hypothetical protein
MRKPATFPPMRPWAIPLGTCLCAACGEPGYDLRIVLPEGGIDRVARVEVALLRADGCTAVLDALGAPAEDPIIVVDALAGETFGNLRPGSYGLYARAWDRSCRLFAANCLPTTVDAGGSASLDVILLDDRLVQDGCDPGDACLPCEEGRCDGWECHRGDGLCGRGPAPSIVASVPTPGAASSVSAPGWVYVVDAAIDGEHAGLRVVHPDGPVLVGSIDHEGLEAGVVEWWSRVRVAGGFTGVHGFSLDVDGRPSVAATDRLVGTPGGLWPSDSGDLLVAAGDEGILVTNGDPLSIVRQADTPGEARGLAAQGSWVAVADGAAGLTLVEHSAPTVGVTIETGDVARGVATDETLVHVASGTAGLVLVDWSARDAPFETGRVDVGGRAEQVRPVGTLDLVAAAGAGIVYVDVSNPASPTVVGRTDTPGQALDVSVQGGFAYVADHEEGLQVVDLACFAPPPPEK